MFIKRGKNKRIFVICLVKKKFWNLFLRMKTGFQEEGDQIRHQSYKKYFFALKLC